MTRAFLLIKVSLIILLAGCSIFSKKEKPPGDVKIETYSISIDKIDPEDRKFPGGRGENQLVLYTPDSGDRTGTNQWGAEFTVTDGIVRSAGGNNSRIPDNGFVLSGHGDAARWITENIYPGVEISIQGKSLNASVTDVTRTYFARSLVSESSAELKDNLQKDPTIREEQLQELETKIEYWIERSSKAADSGNQEEALSCAQESLDLAWEYFYLSRPSRDKELRACWYRLNEKNPAELEETIKKISEAGFNAICPETIYWGYAIYPDAHPSLKQNPVFSGWDPLQELCRLGDKYDIAVIPWVEVFFIGFKESPLIEEKSEWLAMTREGAHASSLEKGYYYFCPSREDVHEFWIQTYSDLMENYDIDGLQLDYIRYPRSDPWEKGYCYCPNCREKFYNLYETDPASLTPEEDPEIWEKWSQFRRKQITDFVKKVRELIDRQKPGVRLSADIFPDLAEAEHAKLQPWDVWLENGLLDEIFSMSYTTDVSQVRRETKKLAELAHPDCLAYSGLGPYLGLSAEILLREIQAAREAGADGFCMFSLETMTDEHLEALKKGPFRRKAKRP